MKKFFALGLVAIALSVGLVLVSCGNKNCPGDGKCELEAGKTSFCDNFTKLNSDYSNKCFGKGAVYGDKCACK